MLRASLFALLVVSLLSLAPANAQDPLPPAGQPGGQPAGEQPGAGGQPGAAQDPAYQQQVSYALGAIMKSRSTCRRWWRALTTY
jgi:hypothetical protein